MNRLIVICPENLLLKANHLACCLGTSMADIESFTSPIYEDDNGDKYCICNVLITENFKTAAVSALVRPDFDTGNEINMTWAAEMQSLIDFDLTDITTKLSAKYVDSIPASHTFIADMGLTLIPVVIE